MKKIKNPRSVTINSYWIQKNCSLYEEVLEFPSGKIGFRLKVGNNNSIIGIKRDPVDKNKLINEIREIMINNPNISLKNLYLKLGRRGNYGISNIYMKMKRELRGKK